MHIMRYDILERKRVDCGRMGRETVPSFYCYGAAVHKGLVYFAVHGGSPVNSYLLVYDPESDNVPAE